MIVSLSVSKTLVWIITKVRIHLQISSTVQIFVAKVLILGFKEFSQVKNFIPSSYETLHSQE